MNRSDLEAEFEDWEEIVHYQHIENQSLIQQALPYLKELQNIKQDNQLDWLVHDLETSTPLTWEGNNENQILFTQA